MTPSQRESLILEHVSIVRAVAVRVARRLPAHVDLDELISTGMIGLIDAVDRFEPARGVPFVGYAEIRVRGAIIDAMRTSDWVPRRVRRESSRLATARAELEQRLGRAPRAGEVAERLEVEPAAYEALRRRSEVLRLVSLDAPTTEDGATALVDSLADSASSTEERIIAAEERATVRSALGTLPDRERTVLAAYYQAGSSLRSIGASLGVTEARACQLRGQGVRLLREQIEHRAVA